MKIIFMGTPDFSVTALSRLIESDHEILCVYSQPPRKSGRGQKENKTPVHNHAISHGLEVRTPLRLKNNLEEQEYFRNLGADFCIVVAYGLLLPQEILSGTKYGCLNIHGSLLPKWRGASPIQRSIESGDDTSGITIMQMNEGLDTGDMLMKGETPITLETTAGTLHDTLSEMGADLICKVLSDYKNLTHEKQDDTKSTYASKITKDETKLDFRSHTSTDLERKIRAFSPFPATFFEIEENGKAVRIKILSATTEDIPQSDNFSNIKVGSFTSNDSLKILCKDNRLLVLTKIQKSGKKPMDSKSFLLGTKTPPQEWKLI